MNTETLHMILKLRQWEEELEKQKFARILSERQRIEFAMKELQERFSQISWNSHSSSEQLLSIYSEIQYLISEMKETEEIIKKIDEEIEKQRQSYEESFKERKKIEQLYDKLVRTIKTEREKLEEKMLSQIFLSRIRRR